MLNNQFSIFNIQLRANLEKIDVMCLRDLYKKSSRRMAGMILLLFKHYNPLRSYQPAIGTSHYDQVPGTWSDPVIRQFNFNIGI
jgi:hypothetical protein